MNPSTMPRLETTSIQTIKTENYRTIGYIEVGKEGGQIGMDRAYRRVAYFDPMANVTRDANHQPIALGNALTDILSQDKN